MSFQPHTNRPAMSESTDIDMMDGVEIADDPNVPDIVPNWAAMTDSTQSFTPLKTTTNASNDVTMHNETSTNTSTPAPQSSRNAKKKALKAARRAEMAKIGIHHTAFTEPSDGKWAQKKRERRREAVEKLACDERKVYAEMSEKDREDLVMGLVSEEAEKKLMDDVEELWGRMAMLELNL